MLAKMACQLHKRIGQLVQLLLFVAVAVAVTLPNRESLECDE